LALAETVLSEFFFDPDNEDAYKLTLSQRRPSGTNGVVLKEETFELDAGNCTLRLEALRAVTRFRLAMTHPAFPAAIEGIWSFDNEELQQTRCTRDGDAEAVEAAVDALLDIIDERTL